MYDQPFYDSPDLGKEVIFESSDEWK